MRMGGSAGGSRSVTWLVGCIALAGCGGRVGDSGDRPSVDPALTSPANRAHATGAQPTHPELVALSLTARAFAFDPTSSTSPQIFGGQTGLSDASNVLTVDLNAQEIFVLSSLYPPEDSHVLVFAQQASGDAAPIRDLDLGYEASSIQVDSVHHELWVGEASGYAWYVYDSSASVTATPLRTLYSSHFAAPVAIDAVHDEVFVPGALQVSVYARTATDNAAPIRVLDVPYEIVSIALGASHDELIVVTDGGRILTYGREDQGAAAPKRIITGAFAGVLGTGPFVAIHEPLGEIVFSDITTQRVITFDRLAVGAASPLYLLSTPNVGVVAIDSANAQLIIGAPARIDTYPVIAAGDASPVRRIMSPLATPSATVLDGAHQEVFVARTTLPSVVVLDRGAAPAVQRTLMGPATGLVSPQGLALDAAHDELWVADFWGFKVSAFPRTADGNVAPLRSIDAPLDPWGNPLNPDQIAIDGDELWVNYQAYGKICVYDRHATGSATPLRSFQAVGGALVVLHDKDEVVFRDTAAVTTYPRLANGPTSPLRTFIAPVGEGLSYDQATDRLWTVRTFHQKLLAYPRDAEGSPSPVATLGGPAYDLNGAISGAW
jgi:hypothetical protein